MIRIRCSGTPPLELDLEGTRGELTELRDAILRFCKLKRPLLEVAVDTDFDPAPYDRRLSGLRLVRTNRKVRVEIDGDRLLVTGKLELLEVFAMNMPCEAERAPAQVRFDAEGMGETVEADSLGIVLSLSGRAR
jgi:hypothetical protein